MIDLITQAVARHLHDRPWVPDEVVDGRSTLVVARWYVFVEFDEDAERGQEWRWNVTLDDDSCDYSYDDAGGAPIQDEARRAAREALVAAVVARLVAELEPRR